MNILELLYKELEEKKSLSIDDKKRLIYLRLCQLFSYDTRYHYVNYLGEYGKEIKDDILNRTIDLERVVDFRVCCTSFSKAYSDALKKLLNVESRVIGGRHKWVELESDGKLISADGTLVDLTRSKFDIRTRGYGPYRPNNWFNGVLENRDVDIGYINPFYENIANLILNGNNSYEKRYLYEFYDRIKDTEDRDERERYLYNEIARRLSEYLANNLIKHCNTDPDLLGPFTESDKKDIKEKLDSKLPSFLQSIIRTKESSIARCTVWYIAKSFNEISGKLKNYEDAKFLLDYMLQSAKFSTDHEIFNKLELFLDNGEDWSFAPIYIFNIDDEPMYYTLVYDNGWKFKPISLRKVKTLCEEYKGQRKNLIYH